MRSIFCKVTRPSWLELTGLLIMATASLVALRQPASAENQEKYRQCMQQAQLETNRCFRGGRADSCDDYGAARRRQCQLDWGAEPQRVTPKGKCLVICRGNSMQCEMKQGGFDSDTSACDATYQRCASACK